VSVPAAPEPEDFRDRIATADRTGKRIWVYPLQPKGRLYTARTIVAAALLIFFFAAPFIRVNGQPLILLDVLNRNFIVFGLVFRPQDFYLFVLAILTLLVFVVQFTAIFGRLFCGWICPQTVFMEMVFRRLEYLIDGGPNEQRRLRGGSWTGVKIAKWLLKQGAFSALSFVICNFFLAYIIGSDALIKIITDLPSEHATGLAVMLIFTLFFYGVFSWFREQACTLVCPYGRLQGVLLDANSIQVAYDYNRGEPRGRFRKGEDRSGNGDCITCRACMAVCPTGIDIRDGSQLECVNCTACIDACNAVMRKVGLREGLIRYTSEGRLKGFRGFRLSGRVVLYTVALVALLSLLTSLLATRADVEVTLLRTPGTLFYETGDEMVRNLYTLRLVNKTYDETPVQLRLKAHDRGKIVLLIGELLVKPGEVAESPVIIDLPEDELKGALIEIQVEVISGDRVLDEITTSFAGPGPETEDD
jgi:cytochrome c oxidase accessory protein FixG